MKRNAKRVLLLATLLATACGDGLVHMTGIDRQAVLTGDEVIEITYGANQVGAPNTQLKKIIKFTVKDHAGGPVLPYVRGTITVTSGGGSVSKATFRTGSTGLASFYWTLGSAGTQRVTVQLNEGGASAIVAARVYDATSNLVITVGNNQTGLPGDTLNTTVRVRFTDADGLPLPGVPVKFQIQDGSGGGVRFNSLLTNPDGRAVNYWALGWNKKIQQLVVKVEGSDSVIFNATANTTGYTFEIHNGNDQTGAPNAALSDPIVAVLKKNGVVVPGAKGTWTVVAGGGQTTTSSFTTNVNGRAITTWTLGAVGPQTVKAKIGAVDSVVFNATSFEVALVNRRIAIENNRGCVLAANGDAHCFSNDQGGVTGVLAGKGFVAISSGEHHSCALTASGAAWCWGLDAYGALGDGSVTDTNRLAQVSGGHVFVDISVGSSHTTAITATGQAYAWGNNNYGQLGSSGWTCYNPPHPNPTYPCSSVPVPVSGGFSFKTASAGDDFVIALTASGTAYAWGDNGKRQLGTGSNQAAQFSPVPVAGGHRFKAVDAGFLHAVALDASGAAWSWGNSAIELGIGSTSFDWGLGVPVPVIGGHTGFEQVRVGRGHSLLLKGDGTAWAWGPGAYGANGDGTTTDRYEPVQVAGGISFREVDIGGWSFGISTSGTGHGWGLIVFGPFSSTDDCGIFTFMFTVCPRTPAPLTESITF